MDPQLDRNEEIVAAWKSGKSAYSLAKEQDMSPARVHHIIGRALMRDFRDDQASARPVAKRPGPVVIAEDDGIALVQRPEPKPRKRRTSKAVDLMAESVEEE